MTAERTVAAARGEDHDGGGPGRGGGHDGSGPGPGLGHDRGLTLAIALLAVAGLAIAGYLTWVHYADVEPVCTTGGCAKVQGSEYAELAGVPVALLGLLGYVAILASLAIPGETGRAATALLALVGFGYSAYLTYLELGVIDAICQWCVGSAVVMTAIAVLAVVRLLRAP